MKHATQPITLILLFLTPLIAPARGDQKSKAPASLIHIVTCRIEKITDCASQEASSGYSVIHVAATVMDRPRDPNSKSPGYGIWRSEDPVLITQRSAAPKRQTVAIIDDLPKREQQLNQAGNNGMRLITNEIVALRSWSGGVSVDAYAALFEETTPLAKFDYRVVDAAGKTVSDRLKQLLSEGYRSVAFVPPAIILMERGSENPSVIDEYQVLQGFDAQHIGPEIARTAASGFRVVAAGASPTAQLTTVLMEHLIGDQKKIEYQVFSGYSARELEKKLNETAKQEFAPVNGGILPINASKFGDRGMAPPPQRVELIVSKPSDLRYSDFKVLDAFGRGQQAKLDAAFSDGYEFVKFVGLVTDNFVILGHPAHPQ